jgi:hypothetical protein
MATFVDIQYASLGTRKDRVVSFFAMLETKLVDINAPSTGHLDLEWNGSKVVRSLDGVQISSLDAYNQLKYYTQGLGLMKLAMNNQLYA